MSSQSAFSASSAAPPDVTFALPTPTPARALRRVLHIINGQHYSGAERVQDLLALQLPASGFEVEFACVKPRRFPVHRVSTSPLHTTAMRSRVDVTAAWKIVRLLRRAEFSLIHAHTPRSALIGSLAARITGVPLVYHVHSPTSHDSTHAWRDWLNSLNEQWCVRRAAALIAVSESLGRRMRASGYDRVVVVPNGVPQPPAMRSAAPPENSWTLGAVALFRPRKGLEVLIEALGILRREGYAVRLRAVGPFETPEYEASVRKWVARHDVVDAIDWTGFTTDVNSELTQMDVFVLPSLFGEGLPMVVLEAMAAGVPVLGTRVEGVPEAIEDGRSGLLSQPGSASDLARQLRALLEGQYEWGTLRREAQRRHADRYSDTAMAAGVAEVYRRTLGD